MTAKAINAPQCYTDDWQRTEPDYVIHLPEWPGGSDEYSDHIHVFYTPGGDLMCIWTTGTFESAPDSRTLYSRSTDGGHSWAPAKCMAEPPAKNMTTTAGFPLVSRSGRIYCMYAATPGAHEGSLWCGPLHVLYSDDDGFTWVDSGVEIPFRRTRYDHPDPKVPPDCIIWQQPVRDAEGRMIVGLTRWASKMVYPRPLGGNRWHTDSQCELMRFDNIDDGPDPKDIKITWLPDEEGTIRVNCGIEPDASKGYSLAEEPAIVCLPDGRLWMNMRTVTGSIWYTVSDDHGHSWRPPEPLLYRDGGREVRHVKSPEPIYRLEDGRYLLFYSNRDGHDQGDTGPWDMAARRPICIAVGAFRPDAYQPIWFSEPKLLMDTQRVKTGMIQLDWLAMYASLTERNGRRIFWYADRKTFVVGKDMPDELLADMLPPE
ncbi:MAG: sialidase family protein [Lentisphaeria bacterium]